MKLITQYLKYLFKKFLNFVLCLFIDVPKIFLISFLFYIIIPLFIIIFFVGCGFLIWRFFEETPKNYLVTNILFCVCAFSCYIVIRKWILYLNKSIWLEKLFYFSIADYILPQTEIEELEYERLKKFINKRFDVGWSTLKQMMPILHTFHKMNAKAKNVHESYLSDRFTEKEIKKIFETDYSDSEVEKAILFWRNKEMPEKISFMKYLFMFTVLEDGIHKDEWYMLMNVMAKLKINRRFTESLRRKYVSLRTEFEEWEYKKSDSADQNSSSNLNPYYMILGLDESASEEEVKKAYHALVLQYHPDLPKNADRIQECEEMMVKLNEAYDKIRG